MRIQSVVQVGQRANPELALEVGHVAGPGWLDLIDRISQMAPDRQAVFAALEAVEWPVARNIQIDPAREWLRQAWSPQPEPPQAA